MKSLYLRSGLSSLVALTCALGLSGCGGASANLAVGGSVSGLAKTGLVLQNKGGPDLVVAAGAKSFVFQELMHADDEYNVTIKTPPTGAECTVADGKGRSAFNVNTVRIGCITYRYPLGGTIEGLGAASDLVLSNGSDLVKIPANKDKFLMAEVEDDTAFGITVFQQPVGLNCSVTGGVGLMVKATKPGLKDPSLKVDNVLVKCVPTTPPVATAGVTTPFAGA